MVMSLARAKAGTERAEARPPDEWCKDTSLPAVPPETQPDTDQPLDQAAIKSRACIRREERKLEKLWRSVESLYSEKADLAKVVAVLRRSKNEVLDTELAPSWADVFWGRASGEGWSRSDHILSRAVGRIRKASDVGGYIDGTLFEDFRKMVLDPFVEKTQQLDQLIGNDEKEIRDLTKSLIEQQALRVKRLMRLHRAGNIPSSEMERAILETDVDTGKAKYSKEARKLLKSSATSTRYSVAGMILESKDPLKTCREALEGIAAASQTLFRETPENILREDLFALEFVLHRILRERSGDKRNLHRDILTAELEAFEQELSQNDGGEKPSLKD